MEEKEEKDDEPSKYPSKDVLHWLRTSGKPGSLGKLTISKTKRSKRHDYVVLSCSRNLDFGLNSKIVGWGNASFLEDEELELVIYDVANGIYDRHRASFGWQVSKVQRERESFRDRYVSCCLIPELLIAFVAERDGVVEEEAERRFLTPRMTARDLRRLNEESRRMQETIKRRMERRRRGLKNESDSDEEDVEEEDL
jgi:hypothetical protein